MKCENVFYASHDKKRQFTRSGDMMKNIEKRNLIKLADDFLLLKNKSTHMDILRIVDTCSSYEEGRRKIMRLYEGLYM